MSGLLHDCVGALLVRDGRVLLGRRSPDCRWLANAWDVFGGHIEPGETAEEALRRELLEELGIAPLQYRLLETIRGEAPEPWRLHLYAMTDWEGEPRNRAPREHAEIRWCILAEAQERLRAAHPDFPRLLQQVMQGE